ncbi:Hypothetical protein D9617_17g047690 [Elsinoe fawcettii]|nr:Hypothetical protein D9617_17g047690 [Elsinoe fawcettii]
MKPPMPSIDFDPVLDRLFTVLPEGITAKDHSTKTHHQHVYTHLHAHHHAFDNLKKAAVANEMEIKAVIPVPTRTSISGYVLKTSSTLQPPQTSSSAKLYGCFQTQSANDFVPIKIAPATTTPGAHARDPPEDLTVFPLQDDNDVSAAHEVVAVLYICLAGLIFVVPGPVTEFVKKELRMANYTNGNQKTTFPRRPKPCSPFEMKAWIGLSIDVAQMDKSFVPVWPMVDRIWAGIDELKRRDKKVWFEMNTMAPLYCSFYIMMKNVMLDSTARERKRDEVAFRIAHHGGLLCLSGESPYREEKIWHFLVVQPDGMDGDIWVMSRDKAQVEWAGELNVAMTEEMKGAFKVCRRENAVKEMVGYMKANVQNAVRAAEEALWVLEDKAKTGKVELKGLLCQQGLPI